MNTVDKKGLLFCLFALMFEGFAIIMPGLLPIFIIGFVSYLIPALVISKYSYFSVPLFLILPIIFSLNVYYSVIPALILLCCIITSIVINANKSFKSATITLAFSVCAFAFASSLIIVYALTSKLSYVGIKEALSPIKDKFLTYIMESVNILKQSGSDLGSVNIDAFVTEFTLAFDKVIIPSLPGIIFAICLVISFISMVYVKRRLYRVGYDVAPLGMVRDFELSKVAALFYVVTVILRLFVTNYIISIALLNFYLLMSMLFFMAGISATAFIISNAKMKRGQKALLIIALVVSVLLGFYTFIILLGLIAAGGNLKRLFILNQNKS